MLCPWLLTSVQFWLFDSILMQSAARRSGHEPIRGGADGGGGGGGSGTGLPSWSKARPFKQYGYDPDPRGAPRLV